MKKLFLTVLLFILIAGFSANFTFAQCTCTTGCSSLTVITMPFTKEGIGEFCFQATCIGPPINSWSLDQLVINGVDFTNKWADASGLPAAASDGTYYIYYKGSYSYSHFEAQGSCAGATTAPAVTNAPTTPPTDTLVSTTPPQDTLAPTAQPGDTLVPTETSAPTATPDPTGIPTATPGETPVSTSIPETPAPTSAPETPVPTTPPTATLDPTQVPGTDYTGNATYFYSLGAPYGGCGLPQAQLDSPHFVAVNVYNSPGDYTTFYNRPIAEEYASGLGFFNNGLNCGRWVHVTIGDYCNGTNDGAMYQPFCRDGTGWISDEYNGAELDMILADSCYDGNAWCRDDANHLDLAQASLNLFVKDGLPVGDMFPDHWNNRQVSWHFIEAPNYTGDIRIGFILSAQIWWPTVSITHLQNGIHGVDCFDGTNWVKATMNGDMGQSYILVDKLITNGVPSGSYRIRIYDVNDQLINSGRIYNFSFPTAICGSSCSAAFNEITYTIE